MSLTDKEKRELDVNTLEWLGIGIMDPQPSSWDERLGVSVYNKERGWFRWNPRHCLDDSHLLLEECERRGLLYQVAHVLLMLNTDAIPSRGSRDLTRGAATALILSPEQITLAVWEGVREYGKDGDQ